MRIDAHHHLWQRERVFRTAGESWALGSTRYAWAEADLPTLNRSFESDELVANLDRHQFDGSVLVNVLDNLDETRWLLDAAIEEPRIRGVIGWVDLLAPPELIERDLDGLRTRGPLVGIRHLTQFEPDPRWLVRPAVLAGLRVLARMDLVLDLLVTERELPLLPDLARAIPDLTLVLDHAGKPPIRSGELAGWAAGIRRAAENPRMVCKVSGLVTEADHRAWRLDDLLAPIGAVIEAFGPERLMFGSDWPVATLAADYDQVVEAATVALERLLGGVFARHEPAIFGGLATRVYRLSQLT